MNWQDIEEIAQELEKNYEAEEIPEYDLPYLEEMVLSLPNFEDHEITPEASVLKKIAEAWAEIREQ